MKPTATSASPAMKIARAHTRAARSSSMRVRIADASVSGVKKPTTIHAHGLYDDGKVVRETVTYATPRIATRRRTSHSPWRLGSIFGSKVLRRDTRIPLEEPAVVARHVETLVATPQLSGIG